MNDTTEIQVRVNRALRTVAQAPAPEGLEERVAIRLRERQREKSAQPTGLRAGFAWATVGALAVAGLVMAIVCMQPHAPTRTVAVARPSNGAPLAQPIPATATPTPVITKPRRRQQTVADRNSTPETVADLRNPPPLPLTQQERLLLALAHSPSLLPQLGSIAHSETVSDHGVGRNTIFELDHQELKRIPNALIGDL